MTPKLHQRGRSFKGACDYVLHDLEQSKSNERVEWAMTVNTAVEDHNLAWREMMDTYHAQNTLKTASGHDLRGRKNTKPVLHFTLSWAPSETPTPEQMKAAAGSSLKAIGLEDHEPPRVCRRLQLLRDWSHDESIQAPTAILAGGA